MSQAARKSMTMVHDLFSPQGHWVLSVASAITANPACSVSRKHTKLCLECSNIVSADHGKLESCHFSQVRKIRVHGVVLNCFLTLISATSKKRGLKKII
jgi:hypothetical protein